MIKGKGLPRTVPRQAVSRRVRRRSPLVLILLLLLWSLILGWGLAQASSPTPSSSPFEGIAQTSPIQPNPAQPSPAPVSSTTVGTVDVVPRKLQLSQEIYLENCATCHVGVPPEVFPTETWRRLLQDPQHYGQQLRPLIDPPRLLVWNYLRAFSRPQLQDEEIPYRMADSRSFKILHPKVKFAERPNLGSCITCHTAAAQFNYRTLSPVWENAP